MDRIAYLDPEQSGTRNHNPPSIPLIYGSNSAKAKLAVTHLQLKQVPVLRHET